MTAHIADQQGWMIIGNITVTYSFPIPLLRCFKMFLLFVFDLFAGGLPWRGQGLIPCSIKGCRWRQISIQVDPARYRSLRWAKIHRACPHHQNQCMTKFVPNHKPIVWKMGDTLQTWANASDQCWVFEIIQNSVTPHLHCACRDTTWTHGRGQMTPTKIPQGTKKL